MAINQLEAIVRDYRGSGERNFLSIELNSGQKVDIEISTAEVNHLKSHFGMHNGSPVFLVVTNTVISVGFYSYHPTWQRQEDRATSEYTDPFGNTWNLEVRGTPDLIDSFIENRNFMVYAKPITPHDQQKIIDSTKDRDNSNENYQSVNGNISLEVHMELKHLIFELEQPFQIYFYSDFRFLRVDEGSGDDTHVYSVYRSDTPKAIDTLFNVSFKANGGPIRAKLRDGDLVEGVEGSVDRYTHDEQSTTLWITRLADQRIIYTLAGDDTIPAAKPFP